MAKRTKKTHPERAVLKGSGGGSMLLQRYKYYRNNKTFSEKVSKKVMRGGTMVKRRGATEHDSSNKRNDI